ncbi:hypothetical protein B5X24_HaOG205109 [Helicoverpa armigera]|uniref:Uncharacterized protein n=1 Tax=Helicoverpa armigera TaxID=29058 RepID=A0A2W1BMI0_HELAM|nr:hypothetical protein B5X24_HaOG205109 [Helicoverpa armigera]
MVLRTRSVLFILIITAIHGLQSKSVKLKPEKDREKTLIVLVDNDKSSESINDEKNYYRSDELDPISDTNALDNINNALVKANYQTVLYDILRSDRRPNNEEEREAQEILIEQALRSRCQQKVQCEEKCSRSQERKPKKERYCQKSCKAVYDDLIKCPPKGNKKKNNKNRDKCGKKGKTCPPSWK